MLSVTGITVAQLKGSDVCVTVTGPLQIGQPSQSDIVKGCMVPPTQHAELSLDATYKTPGQLSMSLGIAPRLGLAAAMPIRREMVVEKRGAIFSA